MNKYRKLLSNTFLFAIGSFGTKFITFLMAPLYTYFLSTEEFGRIDLINTTILLAIPIITLGIYESVLRYIMDKNEDPKSVMSNSVFILLGGLLLCFLLSPLLRQVDPIRDNLLYFYILLTLRATNTLLLQFTRAIGKIKLFAVNSIILALSTLIFTIAFLAIMNLSVRGYFMAVIIANFISFLLLFTYGKVYNFVSYKSLSKSKMKVLLLFSIPLMPNAIMWWVVQISDRYLVFFFAGAGATGLYAIAAKIPAILSMVNSVFFQAWQLSAIEESESEQKSVFYSNVFSLLLSTLVLVTSAVLMILRPIFRIIIADEFYSAWRYVPFLLVATIFSSFAVFLGTNYVAMKKTSGALITNSVGAALSIILNIILIPRFGPNGASFSTMISFLVIWLLRMYNTRKFVTIKLNIIQVVISFVILAAQIAMMYFGSDRYFSVVSGILIIVLLLVQYPSFKILLSLLKSRKEALTKK